MRHKRKISAPKRLRRLTRTKRWSLDEDEDRVSDGTECGTVETKET
jgi:hypothetical protein